ncbi:two-component system sensor histidine kinase YesM [Metabacillus crassostreae]|uniref:sensor histidine kinase n=1 Tax=Metabacillus crassostreae TaxID=929098 RepID=UPI00195AB11B|nr:sensor histidine kinase [Metabacillus crassostreae]MBM7604342.1 two-component system sensor histidine kinase YesM [Metabacillus crassostreae]
MKFLQKHFRYNGLFTIMFLISVISIVSVSVIITWTTFRMSEEFFIDKFSITNGRVMTQVKDSIESYNYSVVLASNNILQSGTIRKNLTEEQSNEQQMRAFYEMYQQMKRVKSNVDAYETEIIITGINGMNYATNRPYWPIPDDELIQHTITKNTMDEPKKLMYHFDQRDYQIGDNHFIVASKALMERISGDIYGAMYFSIQESEFRKFYSSYTSEGNNVYILDNNGLIVSSNQTKMIGQKADELLSYALENEGNRSDYLIEKFMGTDQIIFMEYLPSLDMYLFNLIDRKTAIGDLINKKQIVLISMGIVVIALIIVFFISRRITNSLSHLVKQIADASKFDFDKYVSVTGTYETRRIGEAFNSMLDELHDYLEKLVLYQKQKRNAELAALQQQINPHFLYNTLTSIKFMVQQGSKDEAEEIINSLIALLQNTIGNVSETISVEQEINNLKNYVLINQKRYGDRIKVNYLIGPGCMEYHVPKLILQPFIENSFFHGFNHKSEGFINVLVWQENNTLICEVMDNGDGMEMSSTSELPKIKSKRQHFTGIGVKNVHERIQLIYGNQYGVTINSTKGEGTRVKITLPITNK